jgi:hypothetical protein
VVLLFAPIININQVVKIAVVLLFAPIIDENQPVKIVIIIIVDFVIKNLVVRLG